MKNMKKNIFEDMVKVKRAKEGRLMDVRSPLPYTVNETKKEKKTGTTKNGIWVVAVLAVIFLFFTASNYFTKAEIVINPEVKDISINDSFSAIKGGLEGELAFDLVVFSDEQKKTIKGGEEKEVNEKAKGSVIIFNTYGYSPQVLDINTRLLGTNGKIYKTEKRIVVPPMQKDGLPGKVEIAINASLPGEEYNSPPMDFKIVGFKGTPKYEKFFGRSNGEITGGEKKIIRDISNTQRESILLEMEPILREKLMEKISEKIRQIPEGFVLFDDAVFIEIGEEEITAGEDLDTSIISLKGTLFGFLLNKEELSNSIFSKLINDYEKGTAYITSFDNIKFSLIDKEKIMPSNVNSVANINFTLLGDSQMVYKINTETLASEFIGRRKNEFENILSKHEHIYSANLSIRPVWKKDFPKVKEKIEVIVNYP